MSERTPMVLLDDARSEGAAAALAYAAPLATFVARRPQDVADVLAAADAARREKGKPLAGYIAYEAGLALEPVRDLVALDPYNPRAVAFQVGRIAEHLESLPALRDDGMAEPHQIIFYRIEAALRTATAETLDGTVMLGVENMLSELSNAISARFFLQGSEGYRMSGMTLA